MQKGNFSENQKSDSKYTASSLIHHRADLIRGDGNGMTSREIVPGMKRLGLGRSGMTSQTWQQPSSPIIESILLNSPFQLHDGVIVSKTF